MSTEILLIEKKDRVGTLIFNRPEKRNSLSPDLLIRIHQTLENFAQEDEIRAVVVRGIGDQAFSSGYDIAAIPTEVSPQTREKLRDQNPLDLALNSVINFPYPVIALLNGYAFGAGCELAVCCDLRIGADDIRMGMPPAKLGLVYQLGRPDALHSGGRNFQYQRNIFYRSLLSGPKGQGNGPGGLSAAPTGSGNLCL